MTDTGQKLTWIADELRGMATLLERFNEDAYNKERAARLMELAAELVATVDEEPLEDIKTGFLHQPYGRYSPIVGVDAFLLNTEGEVLLIQRKDNGTWAMPGGLSEIGHTFSETAVIELWEEAGVKGRATRLLGLFDGRLWGARFRETITNMVYLTEADDITPQPGIECLDAQFFSREKLATLELHPGHAQRIPVAWDAYLNGTTACDPADAALLDLPMFQRP